MDFTDIYLGNLIGKMSVVYNQLHSFCDKVKISRLLFHLHIITLYYKIACLYFGMGENKKSSNDDCEMQSRHLPRVVSYHLLVRFLAYKVW